MYDPTATARHQFRDWRNQKRLLNELRVYHAQFEKGELSIPTEEQIVQTLHSKYSHQTPKQKGNLNIVAIYHHYNWENKSLGGSLERFGRVRHYDWVDKYDHQREKNWRKNIRKLMNEDLIQQIDTWNREEPIDILFTYIVGELVTPKNMGKLRGVGIPMVSLALNDKESFIGKIRNGQATGMRDICRYFDLCWTSTKDALEKYCVEGALPVYLSEGANPEIHKPYDVERFIDISFVGQCYGNRPALIQVLKDHGIHVEAFGYGWPNGPLSTEDMVRMYSKSKINLGFGGVAGHKDTYCLKGRDFEIPMSGGLYLTEYSPELEGVFEIGKEMLTYRTFDELVKKIQYLLDHPDEAEAIRQAGHRRAASEHTWEMRFEKIFTLMGLI